MKDGSRESYVLVFIAFVEGYGLLVEAYYMDILEVIRLGVFVRLDAWVVIEVVLFTNVGERSRFSGVLWRYRLFWGFLWRFVYVIIGVEETGELGVDSYLGK